jgi:hypothetical protein
MLYNKRFCFFTGVLCTPMAKGRSAPVYRWSGLKNRSGSIHITISVYNMDSYFNYVYTWAYLIGPQGYTSNGLYYLYPCQGAIQFAVTKFLGTGSQVP